ncbi:type II toxin-antitoxin system PemK/MazF family toxin [Xanthomonas sacchari]|uniref:type II toxin-antitoxin system PemK/MazF family toxin n=1 Tax=Xanthomonas sacchari TaxID=56458 RepID=UPI00224F32D8|nr:type II toxin-antitoxin system PemK/MazF family toxin [Xanthomonas sacchari]UYK67670.1 type II toxin-antitoxin system PemK/MazF family toxin [Xanthomonas sacchari]
MVKYSPIVGEIVECDFGKIMDPRPTPIFNGIILNEIRKRRPAVVLNGKLPNGCCLVVPISSTGNPGCVTRGFHVPLGQHLFPEDIFDRRDRWAIAECMTHVSKERLYGYYAGGQARKVALPREVVADIQRAMIRSLNGLSLLAPAEPYVEAV